MSSKLFSTDSYNFHGGRPNHGRFANDSQTAATGRHTAAHHSIRRRDRSGAAIRHGGSKLSEQQAFDIAFNQIRVGLISVPGIAIPYPYGGRPRLVSVDLDPEGLEEKNLSQNDVTPRSTIRRWFSPAARPSSARSNTRSTSILFPAKIDNLNDLPIKVADGTIIRLSDVAQVRDGMIRSKTSSGRMAFAAL